MSTLGEVIDKLTTGLGRAIAIMFVFWIIVALAIGFVIGYVWFRFLN